MATLKLTDGLVEDVVPAARDSYLWDTALPRFGLRVTPAGARIYLVQYRAKGAPGSPTKTRRITIGQHDGDLWNVTKARAAARKLLAPVDLGHDPFADREEARTARQLAAEAAAQEVRAAQARQRDNFPAVVERYVEACTTLTRSGGETARLLRHGPVKAWADRHIAEVRRADVADLMDTIKARSPSVGRATYAALRGLFAWCVERDLVLASPCDALTAPARPAARDRVLADYELRLIWRAADQLGFPFGPVVKLLMLTGQRRAEVGGMTWKELDLTAGTWRIPKERAKNRKAHEVDLSPEALAVLKALPHSGTFVFPGRLAPARKASSQAKEAGSVRGFSATKRRLDALVEAIRAEDAEKAGEPAPKKPLADWRLHDLRRTAATGMAAMNFPPHVVERVLNHISGTQRGLVGVYQRHEYRAERKAALTAWGTHVEAAVSGVAQPSNVHQLRA